MVGGPVGDEQNVIGRSREIDSPWVAFVASRVTLILAAYVGLTLFAMVAPLGWGHT